MLALNAASKRCLKTLAQNATSKRYFLTLAPNATSNGGDASRVGKDAGAI